MDPRTDRRRRAGGLLTGDFGTVRALESRRFAAWQRETDAHRHPKCPRRTKMSVITRSALEASPLADLHTIASELGIDGYRRLRKADLVDRIIVQQGGEEAVAA
ncbi:MAG TPA: Rho termination factor N-terminal domain-containing protein, partial [Baekduia sp.]|nr:Rho termination factor N-terminal domain-containing protein [Baekduia sp.]